MTSGERRCALVLFALVSSFATRANATTPADVATARELYKDGADALDSGKPQVAVEKLAQAWVLVQTPVIGSDLARAQRAVGRLVEARETALAVQRLPRAPDETARSAQARSEADKIASELESRIPHVKLVVDGVGEHHTATVKLDGAIVPEAALAVARQANPGEHKATLDTDDGRHGEGSITLGEGETKELKLVVPAATEPAVTQPKIAVEAQPTTTEPVAPIATPAHHAAISPVVWVGAVVAGVGLVTGAIAGAFAFNEAGIVKTNCSDNLCKPPYDGDLNAANAFATVSTIGFVTLGVGAAVMLTGFLIGGKPSDTKHARVVPVLGPVSGVAGVF